MFDLNEMYVFAKVVEASKDNPVFYLQYASARIHSTLRKAGVEPSDAHLDRLGLFLAIGAFELMDITPDAFHYLHHTSLHLAFGEVAVAVVDRLEL